jgi:hypothetical protein
MAHIGQVHGGAMKVSHTHIWHTMPADPSSWGSVGMGQRQPRRRRRPQLLWTGVEGWLRQRASDGKENHCIEIVRERNLVTVKSSLFFISCFRNKSLPQQRIHLEQSLTLHLDDTLQMVRRVCAK